MEIIFPDQIAEVKLSYTASAMTTDLPVIKGSDSANQILSMNWDKETIGYREEFRVMLLNRAHRVLGILKVSEGGISGTVVDVRMILQAALLANCSSIILAHNHPSGTMYPSEADKAITKKIKNAAKAMDISVIDHIIISPFDNEFNSFADSGLI